jgi:hypothetical protein
MIPAATACPRAVAAANVAKVGCVGLTIAGGVLEIGGFALVAYKLVQIQSRELGEPRFLRRLRARLRRILGHRDAMKVPMGTATSTERAMPLRVRHSAVDEKLDSRVSALEQNFRHLEEEFLRGQKDLAGSLSDLRTRFSQMRAEFDEERRERDERRKEELRGSVALEACGTALFVLGAILSVLGNTLTC